jgi:hypothetical protein
MLIHFLAKLFQDEKIKAAFVDQPFTAATTAGLTKKEFDALASRDPKIIAKHIEEELRTKIVHPFWAPPDPHIAPPVEPQQGAAGERIATFTIKGEWFGMEAEMSASLEGAALPSSVPISIQKIDGPYAAKGTLIGSVTIPATAKPGQCTVKITRTLGVEVRTDTVPHGFTIVKSAKG